MGCATSGGVGCDMKFQGEIEHDNRRRGPGWWMDEEGIWRSPEFWPEDFPPIPGWHREQDGRWRAPLASDVVEPAPGLGLTYNREIGNAPSAAKVTGQETRRLSAPSEGSGGRRLLTGFAASVVAVGLGVFVAITQAGAGPGTSEPPPTSAPIFAGRTDNDLELERIEAALGRPALARSQLSELGQADNVPDPHIFDPEQWSYVSNDCRSISELVLIERSRVEVGYADEAECVVATGSWLDRFQRQTLTNSMEVSVEPIIPHSVVFRSGGWRWDEATVMAFSSDVDFRAAWSVVTTDSGYNPRNQSVESWRPPGADQQCTYAADWIAVKHRWNLGVSDIERMQLENMLVGCVTTDPDSVQLRQVSAPDIGLNDGPFS